MRNKIKHRVTAIIALGIAAIGLPWSTMLELSAMSRQVGPDAPPGNKNGRSRPVNKPHRSTPPSEAGKLIFKCDMNCWITIDGVRKLVLAENEPEEITLKPGKHTVKAGSGSGLYTWEQLVQVENFKRLTVLIELKKKKAEAEEAARVEGERIAATEAEEEVRREKERKRIESAKADEYIKDGDRFTSEKKWNEAEASYSKAVSSNPQRGEWRAKLGFSLLQQNKWDEAEAELRTALTSSPNNAYCHSNLGWVLQNQNNWTEAEAEYRKAIQIAPNLAVMHANLGFLLIEQQKWEEAEKEYREAVRLNPSNVKYQEAMTMAAKRGMKEFYKRRNN